MSIFNNREIALAIWLFAIFVWAITKKEIRKSFSDLLKVFFQGKIIISVLIMITYTFIVVLILYYIKFWNLTFLKDTIIWFCFTGFVTCTNAVTARNHKKFLRKIIIDNIKLVVFIEFIVNTYTFSLIGELIFLPIITLIIMCDAVASTDKKYSLVGKLTSGLQTIIGLFILVYAVSQAIIDFNNFGSIETLKNVFLAPILTIIFLPFIYFAVLFSKYELLFIRLDLGCEKSKETKRYAKKELIKHCLFSLKKVNEALNMGRYNLMQIKNKDDVNEMIKVYNRKE